MRIFPVFPSPLAPFETRRPRRWQCFAGSRNIFRNKVDRFELGGRDGREERKGPDRRTLLRNVPQSRLSFPRIEIPFVGISLPARNCARNSGQRRQPSKRKKLDGRLTRNSNYGYASKSVASSWSVRRIANDNALTRFALVTVREARLPPPRAAIRARGGYPPDDGKTFLLPP